MKTAILVLILALSSGAAFAQTNNEFTEADRHPVSATVEQDIKVMIPHRFALHINQTRWDLDLDNAKHIEMFCRFVSKNHAAKPHVNAAFLVKELASGSPPAWLVPATGFGYPAIDPNAGPDINNYEKGYLFCFRGKVVQKFANDPDGWRLDITFSGAPLGGFGAFAIADRFVVPGTTASVFEVSGTHTVANGQEVLDVGLKNSTTQGWLNNYITEGFFFDGSEVAGDYTLTVTYTLTGL
jgi:hypothetical protein